MPIGPTLDPRSWRVRLAAFAGAASVLVAPLPSLAFTYGNFVVTHGTDIVEYRTDGKLVQTIPVPYPPGSRTANDPLGGIMFDSEARLAVYNGASTPYLSVFDATNGTWTHASLSGWTTFTTVGLAGLVTIGRDVFVTDFGTLDGPERGVIEFDGDGSYSGLRFSDIFDTADLAVDAAGRVHALLAYSNVVMKYDGATKQDLGSVSLEGSVQGIAVREDGAYYGASTSGEVRRFTAEGASVDTLDTGIPGLFDVAIGPWGDLAIGSALGEVVLADSALESAKTLLVGGGPAYVAWVPYHSSTPVVQKTWGRIKSTYRR